MLSWLRQWDRDPEDEPLNARHVSRLDHPGQSQYEARSGYLLTFLTRSQYAVFHWYSQTPTGLQNNTRA